MAKEKKRKTKRLDPVAQRLVESEKLYEEARKLNPYPFKPFWKSFSSFDEYEEWKRKQKNPWYR